MEHGKGTHNIRWLVVPVLVMEAQAVEKSVMERLSVLEGNQRQTLWRFLTAQCDQLDRRRAGRLSTALRTAESLKQHLQELRRPLIHSWIEDVLWFLDVFSGTGTISFTEKTQPEYLFRTLLPQCVSIMARLP